MNIAKLTISYDRGVSLNKPEDVVTDQFKNTADLPPVSGSVATRGYKSADGKIVRGLGSHFRSEADAELVKQRDFVAREIYSAFRQAFLAAPIEGLYFVPERGQARTFIKNLPDELKSKSRDLDMRVNVSEFELTAPSDLEQQELADWSKRIKNQLSSISLGRSKDADEAGLKALLSLAGCPMLKKETGNRIKELVAMVREGRMERVEIKRSLGKLDVQVETSTLSPRRAPKIAQEVA